MYWEAYKAGTADPGIGMGRIPGSASQGGIITAGFPSAIKDGSASDVVAQLHTSCTIVPKQGRFSRNRAILPNVSR